MPFDPFAYPIQTRTPEQMRQDRKELLLACKVYTFALTFLAVDLSVIYLSDSLGASIYNLPQKAFHDEFSTAALRVGASLVPGICIAFPIKLIYERGVYSALKINLAAAFSTLSANLIATLIVHADEIKFKASELQSNDAGSQFVAQSIGLMITFGVYCLVSSLCLAKRTRQPADAVVHHPAAAIPMQNMLESGDYRALGDGLDLAA